ncbi:hypothetical protein K492DRAFT_54620 [Lichtheimia hyalospora FSU 10163]|nr:hypothetical protein K492DRAFT_54620 [Lichtheimia hyalospora FSU 10163]
MQDHPYQSTSSSNVPLSGNVGLYSTPYSFHNNKSLSSPLLGGTQVQPASDGLQIRVVGAPDKSRVETQARLCIQLLTSNGTKVSNWSYLKLPERLLSRSRLKRAIQQQQQQRVSTTTPPSSPEGVNGILLSDDSQVLHLDARVICATQREQPVYVCRACIQRERKRAERSKTGNNHNSRRLLDIPEQDRILLFNCGPMVNFTSGDAILPTRIACYCRHHNEKVGFKIEFTMRDHKGNVIATGISPPILITDDHKSTRQKKGNASTTLQPQRKRTRSSCMDDLPLSKSPRLQQQQHPTSTPPLTSSRPGSLSPLPLLADSQLLHSAASSALPTPCDERRLSSLFDPSCCNDNPSTMLSSTQPHSLEHPIPPTPTATAIVPSSYISPSLLHHQQQSTRPSPQLDRLVPAHGPTYGGSEVTILGSGFYRGITCLFGEHAATTIYWNSNTLVCILPPAVQPGPVVVSFKEHSVVLDRSSNAITPSHSDTNKQVPIFTYQDTNDNALFELALQVVGLKSTGKLQDAKKIAMQIVQQAGDPIFLTSSSSSSHSHI